VPPLQNLTFLVIESDAVLRKTEVRILHDMEYSDILEAENGTEAWSIIKNSNIDFIVSSGDLPDMSGIVLLKIIRADSKHSVLPVLLVVEKITRGQVIEAGEAGVSDLILHPFSSETFKKKIQSVIQVDLDPKNIEAEMNYTQGMKLMKENRWDEALTTFKRILSIESESAEVFYNMGYIQTAQGNYDEAILCFRKATLINSHHARAYQQMGEVYTQLGQKEEAEKAFQKAADIYIEKEMDESAEQVLLEVARINPNTVNVYNSLGIVYRRQGKLQEAIKQYQKALKVNPNDENIYYNLSRVFILTKDLKKAKELVTRAFEINPEFNEAGELLKSINMNLESE